MGGWCFRDPVSNEVKKWKRTSGIAPQEIVWGKGGGGGFAEVRAMWRGEARQ